MPIYQWEAQDQTGHRLIGVSVAQSAQALRREWEGLGLRVGYVLDVSQGKPIAGTGFVYHETLANTFAEELARLRGYE